MDLRNILTFFLIAAFALVFPAFPEGRAQAASDWPQWRGHNGSGVSTETGLPEHWGPNSAEIQWRTAIPGTARSSPIASAGRIFLTTAYPEQSSSRISDLFAMLAICSTLILLIYATYTRQEVFYRIGVPSYFKGPRAITELCAWLLFACVMACCLANDAERINKPYGLFRPIPILIPLLGVTVVFSRAPGARRLEFHKAQRGLVEWGRPLMPGLFLVLIAVLLWLAHAPSRYVYVAVSLGLAQPLVRLNPDQQKPGSPVTAEQSLLNYATLAFLTIACITWLDPSLFWSGSTDANIWIRAAVISSFGLVSAIAWAKPSSQIRLAGSVTLLLAAYLVFHYTPLSTSVKTTAVHEHFEVPYTTWKRVLAVTPGIIGAFWHAVVFFLSRGKGDVVSKRSLWIGGHLVAVAIMIFVRATLSFPSHAQTAFAVICVNGTNGKVMWNTVVSRGEIGRIDDYRGSGASSTPSTDGDLVFVHFGGVTACVDSRGQIRWKHTDAQYASSIVYGAASSPLLVDDRLIVLQDRERLDPGRRSYIAAYQKSSGQILWRVEPADTRSSYGTPLALVRDRFPTLVTATSRAVLCYDLRSGSRLWSMPAPVEEIVTSMVTDDGNLYISGGSVAAATMALRLSENNDTTAPELVWSTKRGAEGCASPVLYDGKLFTVNQNGIASCYKGASGQLYWRGRLAPGQYFASLTAADGRIYASNEEGVTTVFEAGTRFRILAQNDLRESIYASPAISDGSIIIRTDQALYCIRRK